MSRWRIVLALSMLFIMGLSLSLGTVQPGKSASTTITVPDDYSTIQEAIDQANQGDAIYVKSGIYPENIVVDKTITLFGQGREDTIIDGSGMDAVMITSNNVVFRGFTVIKGDFHGIAVKSSGCFLAENMLIGNHEGIMLDGRENPADNNTIENCIIRGNVDCGVLIWGSYHNNIVSNIINENRYGIFLFLNSSFNTIQHNECTNNSDAGVTIDMFCFQNTIASNNITANGFEPGFPVWKAGIVLNLNCLENRIIQNIVSDNLRGIYLNIDAGNNIFYHNSFINNIVQVWNGASGFCSNVWDNDYPSAGNYWSSYDGVDQKSGKYQNLTGTDGIGDTPYVIDENNIDHYPLMAPYIHVLGDLNNDDKLNMIDVALAALAFGSTPYSPRWNPEADINQDAIIDLRDIAAVAKKFMPS